MPASASCSGSGGGVGVGGLLQPAAPFDLGNSGTSARLLMGLVAAHPIRAEFTGDASLQRRPMGRVAEPLRAIGARILGKTLPLTVAGHYPLVPARHRLDVPSAQVKSALLLAALNTPGVSEVIEPVPTRDHLERMLALFGADIDCADGRVALRGEAELSAGEFLKLAREQADALDLSMEMMKRAVNVGFSGGEKKRNEMVQMGIIDPRLAILDETDSGLDIDALRVIGAGINRIMRKPDKAVLLITHYQRLLEIVEPDFVHVLAGGRIVRSGGPELALELEREGYADMAA